MKNKNKLNTFTRSLTFIKSLALVLATCGFLIGGLSFAQTDQITPSQILYNGKVLTVDENFSTASAIAISGETILAVGETDEILAMAGADTERVDLEGRTVIPGLIDNHFHYLRGTNSAAYEMRIQGITSRQQVLDDISAKAEQIGPDKWIFIIGAWHEQQFEDRPGKFTREELDAAAPNNPVFIQRTYSAFYLNQLSADVLREVNPDWMSDDDDMIYVDNREGRFVMYAALEYFPFAEDLEGRKGQVTAFNNYLTSLGITTTYDAGYLDGSYDAVEALHAADELPLRIFYAARYWAESARTSVAAAEMLDREAPFQRDDQFGMFGIGEHVHGYLHDSSNGIIEISDDTYNEWGMIVRAAAKNGWYVHEHAMQDTTANRMMDIVEEINVDYPTKDLRWTLGHADLMQPETMQRAKELGWNITLANHTVKVKKDGIASPNVRAIQDSGILWGMGSDGTIVATYNPFHTIWEYTAGKIFPNIVKYKPDEVITREEALIAHTRSNAFIMFMEDKIGTIEAGKYADLVVLDRDYMTVPIDEIRDLKPVTTMVAGKVVYQAE